MRDREPAETIGTRHPPDRVRRVEKDMERLDLDKTEWMAMAVELTLEAKVGKRKAKAFRKPPSRAEVREQARQARLAAAANGRP